jgi:fumarylacetoacetase
VSAATWAGVPEDSAFGAETLPYGIFRRGDEAPRVGVRLGDRVLDASAVAARLAPDLRPLLSAPTLNPLLAAGPPTWDLVRRTLRAWVTDETHRAVVEPQFYGLEAVDLVLPFEVADYVDFYSSREHAENVGRIFRPGQRSLPANWLHLPAGYHGRAGTVVVSGTEVVRPVGQRLEAGSDSPDFGPTRRLDFEAEVGFVVGVPSRYGFPVRLSAFADHVFGVVVVNDWSARDIQAWETVPLGPFLGKSFATTVSAWVTPLAALAEARVPAPRRDLPVLDYLDDADHPWGLDLTLEVWLNGQLIARAPFRGMYWTAAQQLAHLTSNGAQVRTGDLFASGTVSGAGRYERGSLLELSWNGAEPLRLPDGGTRTFLEDGDEVVITATARGPADTRIGLGEARGRVRHGSS